MFTTEVSRIVKEKEADRKRQKDGKHIISAAEKYNEIAKSIKKEDKTLLGELVTGRKDTTGKTGNNSYCMLRKAFIPFKQILLFNLLRNE